MAEASAATPTGRRALIVGLGISGMASAIRLRQIGWTPVVVERSPGRRTGGYFVGIFGSGRAAARRLGVAEYLHDRTPTGSVFDYDRRGNRRVGLSFADLPGEAWAALRGDVEDAAFQALPVDVEIRYSTVPTKIDQFGGGVSVTLSNTADGSVVTEDFDLVIGADGLRSTVRCLEFGPHERYLRRLNHMIATFELPDKLSDLAIGDGAWLMEAGRSMIVYPFKDHTPTALLTYRTDDVDAEFTEPPAVRLRKVFGGKPLGRLLTEVIEAFEVADQYLFDSVEQVHMDSWHDRRVVLVGDAAWCETLYSGLGVSSALAGPDLLGTMIDRYPGDLNRALIEWERQLRPYMHAYQRFGVKQRFFFSPDNWVELTLRKGMARLRGMKLARPLFERIAHGSKASRVKDHDIAAA
ncbi:FAD-dependent monooxygenase [Mycobacterium sp. OTB74]|uniref:FAD-dependent monooxygenase n=1 Tax=Mycobacterium sp. OTB74 TaxID=1853452 RepID=UPI002474E71F|nr:FAD-dependent monooxygenase [Mycobacterium sp. OTB74]MDH6243189.1 2-polyprenyl-6-methoxyphenol hydroxylase-like FAD-dependent oxidoreductase [Mycobacterium sp. OTB74]